MSLSALRPQFAAVLASLTLVACGGGGSSAPAPTDVSVDPGDGQITVTWTMSPGVEYWLAYAAADSVSTASGSGHVWAHNTDGSVSLNSPFVLMTDQYGHALANGTTYAVSINGRIDGGAGGPGSPSLSAVPRPGGFTWTPGSASLGSGAINAVAYALVSSVSGTTTITTPTYLAVGDGSALYRGADGKTWTPITSATTNATAPTGDFKAATYTLGKFIVVGANGVVSSSPDLVTWTAGTSGTTQTLNAVAGNGAAVVAVGDNGTIRYSGDGITWTAATSVPTSAALYGVSYTLNGKWLAVGANGTLLSSTDASSWTAVTTGTTQTLRGIASTYLTTVTSATPGVVSNAIVGDAGTVLTSTDSSTWSPVSPAPASANLRAVVGSASQFLAVGASGAVLTSADGSTWAAPSKLQAGGTGIDPLGLVFAPSPQAQYVVVGPAGANVNSH